MPLDAQDKLQQEEIATLFSRAAKTGATAGTALLRQKYEGAASDLAKYLLELIPPNNPGRHEALEHLKKIALLTAIALASEQQGGN